MFKRLRAIIGVGLNAFGPQTHSPRHHIVQRLLTLANDKWKGKPEGLRSPEWPELERKHLKEEPVCQWCGKTDKLQVHHIAPFHLHPELELVDTNLITLCEEPGRDCHLKDGHLGNWHDFNPDIRKQCESREGRAL